MKKEGVLSALSMERSYEVRLRSYSHVTRSVFCVPSLTSHLIHSKTAATRSLPIERALKTDILTILAVYQSNYSNTNLYQILAGCIISEEKKLATKLNIECSPGVSYTGLQPSRDH